VTHEYVIALDGRIDPHWAEDGEPAPTAIAWAADHVLAVGTDDVVRSISRGDSTFLDLGGCVVTALPIDLERAVAMVRRGSVEDTSWQRVGRLLSNAGLLEPGSALEPGSLADLAFWGLASGESDGPRSAHLVAIVRGGAFTEGDEHTGPFSSASSS
jgi:hypothetical protein